jgi:membrane protein YdbS with pleckstrin-like domain
MNETSKVINTNEEVLWSGQPQFKPYFFSGLPVIIFGLVWSAILLALFKMVLSSSANAPGFAIIILVIFSLVGLFLVFGTPIYALVAYKYIWYVATDKRIIFQSGIIGRDFNFVDYDKVESADVSVGTIDKLFGKNSGNISIQTSTNGSNSRLGGFNLPLNMMHVTDPYAVMSLFKKVSFDIKTDMNYPNALRPEANKGYETSYKPTDTKNSS